MYRKVNSSNSHPFYKSALIVLAVSLLFLQIYHVLHYSMWFDDSFFANVAKNLADGVGYKAVFFDKNYAFHYGISSGPVIILPAALMMFLFGNQYWVPGIANIALIWSLLIGIFFLADDFLGKEKKWPFGFLALSLALLFSTGSYGNENPNGLVMWQSLMGEIPAALCLIVGTFLLFAPRASVRKMLLGGLFLGLAIMSKILAAIAVAAILISYSAKIFTEKNPKKIQLIIVVGFCVAAPFALFELVKFIFLGWDKYLELQVEAAKFYKHYAVVIASYQNNGVAVFADFYARVIVLKRLLGGVYLVVVPATVCVTYFALRRRNDAIQHCVWAGIALILGCFIHVYWWVHFSAGCDRYLVIALVCYLVGLSLLLASIDYKTLSRFQIAAIALFIFMLFASRDREIKYLFSGGFKGGDKRLQEQIVVVEAIKNLQQQGVIMISCGSNFELEYLLPGSLNFKKCEEILSNSFDRPVMFVSYFINPILLPLHVIRGDGDQYYCYIRPIPSAVSSKCNREYLKTENYSLSWCR